MNEWLTCSLELYLHCMHWVWGFGDQLGIVGLCVVDVVIANVKSKLNI